MAKSTKLPEHNVLEDSNAIVSKTEAFLKDKRNRNITTIVAGVLLLGVVALFFYRSHQANQNQEAYEEMFQAENYFQSDSLSLALNGDGLQYGFLDIIAEYSGTEAANLANFYAGACYLKLGDFTSAIRYFDAFRSSDFILQARAYALIGDANMELEKYEDAISAYEDAVDYKPNKAFTPVYVEKLAIAQENAGDLEGAIESYEEIIQTYRDDPTRLNAAKRNKARLEALIN